jgi:polar amino acid transport system substrate-binding protein
VRADRDRPRRSLPSTVSRAVLVAALVALLSAVVACGSASEPEAAPVRTDRVDESVRALLPPEIRESGVLRVGTPLKNPPMVFRIGSEVDGLGADLVQAVADVMGLRVEYSEGAFAGLIPALNADKFDLIAGIILNDTAEREKSANIVSLAISQSALLVDKRRPVGIESVDDLCGRPVGALQGGAQEALLKKTSAQCQERGEAEIAIRFYPDAPTGVAQLQAGRIQAFAATLPYSTYIAEHVQNGKALTIAPAVYPSGVYGMATHKSDLQLAEAVQAAIRATIENGSYAEVHEKWDATGQMIPAEDVVVNGASRGAFSRYESP